MIDAGTQRVIEFNDATCQQLGYTREEFVGLRTSDFDASETPEEADARVQKVRVVLHTIFRDVTEQKRSAAAVGESEHRYRSLFENMLEGYAS